MPGPVGALGELAGGVLEVHLEHHRGQLLAVVGDVAAQAGAGDHVAALQHEHQPVGPALGGSAAQ